MANRFNFGVLAVLMAVGVNGCAPDQPETQLTPDRSVTLTKVVDDVYTINQGNYTSLIVIGEEGVFISDPANTRRAGLLKEEIAKLTPKPVTHIMLTHEHYDHVGGTQVFPDAKIIAQQITRYFFDIDPNQDAPKKVHIPVDDYKKIDMGNGKVVELRHYCGGDGAGLLVGYLPNQKIVYAAADLYESYPTLVPARWDVLLDDFNPLCNRLILNKIINETDYEYVVEGHTTKTDDEYLKLFAAFYNEMFDLSYAWIEKTKKEEGDLAVYENVTSFSKSVDMPKYKHWDNYDALEAYVRRMVLSIHHGG